LSWLVIGRIALYQRRSKALLSVLLYSSYLNPILPLFCALSFSVSLSLFVGEMATKKITKTPRVPEGDALSQTELDILSAMKDQYGVRLNNIPENTCVRYIRGYKDDPLPREKAIAMLGKMLTWREETKVDEIIKETLPKGAQFKSIWPSGLHGVGREGNPILVNRVGQVDSNRLYKEFNMDEVLKFHIQEMEALDSLKESQCKARNVRLYQHIAILDLKGLGLSHLKERFTDPLKKFINIDQDFYPESLYVMIIVNAGLIMKAAWKIASVFIDPLTKEKIKFGAEHLATYIDPANLPKIYGGACGCAGGKCVENPFIAGADANAAVTIAAEGVSAE